MFSGRNDDSYLDEILKKNGRMPVRALSNGPSGGSSQEFITAYSKSLEEQRSEMSKTLEDQAYSLIK